MEWTIRTLNQIDLTFLGLCFKLMLRDVGQSFLGQKGWES